MEPTGQRSFTMQDLEYAFRYFDPPPIDMPREGWKWVEVRNMIEVEELTKVIDAEMRQLDFERKDRFAVTLLLREAAGNAIKHGNRGDPQRTVRINYHASPRQVLLELSDEGRGFDPYLVPNPLWEGHASRRPAGMGLFLMRLYSSWIRFNQQGTRVTLCKRRSSP
jgi:anti-sigma regulatory factor (Ser/Thr protein kinase)